MMQGRHFCLCEAVQEELVIVFLWEWLHGDEFVDHVCELLPSGWARNRTMHTS